jgi:hypothetical protein
MSRLLAIAGKVVGIALVVVAAHAYYLLLSEWAHHHRAFAPYLWLDVSISVVAGMLACIVVLSLNRRNAVGVIVVAVFATIGAFVGDILSNPMTRGRYDHGGETENNALLLDPLGAVVGYLIASVLLGYWRLRKHEATADQELQP